MTVEQLKNIESRHLYRKDASDKRLRRENLDMSVPIDHETTTRLPLVAAETIGIGFGFDRLYVVDLEDGTQHALPSRYEITKLLADVTGTDRGAKADISVAANTYRGVKGTSRYAVPDIALNDGALANMEGHGMFHTLQRQGGQYNSADVDGDYGSWASLVNDTFITAYAGNGVESGNKPKNPNVHTAIVRPATCDEAGKDPWAINFDEILSLASGGDAKNKDALKGLGYLYQYLTPSAWDFVESNQQVIADFSKAVKDIERTLDAVYNRGRSHYGVRQSDSTMHKLIISLIELGAAMRTKRFSPNIAGGADFATHGFDDDRLVNIDVTFDGTTKAWNEGVVNDFFLVINNRYLVAPYWCVNQLNFYDFIEDERERERRDIDRKDAIETLHLIFQHMETEKGLLHGTDSTLPMLLFDKYKEGVLKDFTDYTSVEAAIAGSLMGYRTPRDADHNVQSSTVGNVGYYAQLPSAHGKLLGSEKAEFLDKISEASEHAMLSSNAEMFKDGMQLSSSFAYQALLGRTRFGEAHTDFRVYPGGWMRGQLATINYANLYEKDAATGNKGPKAEGSITDTLRILFFPLLGWTMYSPAMSTHGLLPKGMNGAAYTRGLGDVVEWSENGSSETDHVALWPTNANGDDYWTPGRDQYSSLLLKGTNDLFETWIGRADTVSTEGLTVPSFGSINLVAEMSYDTPHALLTRNFPILRKLYQQAGMSDTIDPADTSFDFMSAGDNRNGTSEWTGSTPWRLMDRHLFTQAAHPRNGTLDLMPFVYASTSLPESWVDVFQLRDWMMFHTHLGIEPIMDAYTRNQTENTVINNGYINSRLVVYVDEVQENGDVRDVTCTPIMGTFRLSAEHDSDHADIAYDIESGMPDSGDLVSLYPDEGGSHEYEMFLLDIRRVRTEREVGGNRVSNSVHLSSNVGVGALFTGDNPALSERDFVPGRGYALRWLAEASEANGVATTDWATAFSQTAVGTVAYLPDDNNLFGVGTDAMLEDGTTENAYLGNTGDPATSATVLTNMGLVYWTDQMGRYIENAREGLEYSRAAPIFTVFDKDILDITESRFRMTLAPFMMTTVGPLTFVGSMDASGASQTSETITGQSRYEVISLSSGAGASAMDESDPEAEDDAAGDDNPEVEVAEQPEVE